MKLIHGLRDDGPGENHWGTPALRGSWKWGWVLWLGTRFFIGVRFRRPISN